MTGTLIHSIIGTSTRFLSRCSIPLVKPHSKAVMTCKYVRASACKDGDTSPPDGMWILDSFGSPNFSSHGEAKVTELSRLQTEICERTYMCVYIYTHVVVMQNVYNVCMYMNMLYIYIHTHTHTSERIHSTQCQTKFGEARTRVPAELERDCLIRDLCAMPGFTGCFFRHSLCRFCFRLRSLGFSKLSYLQAYRPGVFRCEWPSRQRFHLAQQVIEGSHVSSSGASSCKHALRA